MDYCTKYFTVLGLRSGFSGKLLSPINHAMNIDCGTFYLSKSFMRFFKKKSTDSVLVGKIFSQKLI